MKFKINLSLALFLNLTVILLVGCQPSSHLHTTAEDATSAQATEEEDLKPTVDPNDVSNQQTQNGVKYQPIPKKIKNTTSDVDLILDRVTLEKAKMTYNRKNRKIKVTGLVHLFDENKNIFYRGKSFFPFKNPQTEKRKLINPCKIKKWK